MIKLATPLHWEEDELGVITLLAADGVVIFSDDSREIMPEWMDEITRAVNNFDALVASVHELYDAMIAYQMDVDEAPPEKHRKMMERAAALIKAAKDAR